MNPINQSAAGSPLGERAARRMPHRPCAAFGTVVKRHRACAAYGWTGAAALLLVVLLLGSVWQVATAAEAENPLESTTSDTARDSALRSIPFEKLSELDKAKVRSVLANVSLFRRLPVRMIDCDPDLYLFLMRHPDVLANIWETLGISQLQVRQGSAAGTFRVSDKAGTQGAAQIIYQDSDTHLIYGDGAYQGVLAVTPARGRCLLILKSGYVHETDGRHYIISRLDAFVNGIRCLHGNWVLHKDDFGRGLLTAMHAGRTVGILMDTNMTPPQGAFVKFFGMDACTATGLAHVARKTGAAVLPGFMVWEPAERKYVLHFGVEIEIPHTGDAQADILAGTQLCTAAIEGWIRRYPDQWLWIHRRWKTRPAGEPGLY